MMGGVGSNKFRFFIVKFQTKCLVATNSQVSEVCGPDDDGDGDSDGDGVGDGDGIGDGDGVSDRDGRW